MINKYRNGLIILLVVFLTLLSFGAGYFTNDLIPHIRGNRSSGVDEDFAIFWEAWSRVEGSFFGELPTPTQMTYGATRGALEILNDPYTVFVEPTARAVEQERLRGNFGGVGATLERDDEGNVRLYPIAGNPAAAAGVLDGDILVAVDGQEIAETLSLEEIAYIVRGEVGTEVILSVIHPGSTAPVEISITRATILQPSVSFRLLEDTTIGYIRLNRFSSESGGEVGDAVLALQQLGAKELILDLRHNGGGLLDAAVAVSDHFLSEGPVLYQISRSDKEEVFKATEVTVAGDLPLAVLVDGATASSSEIVAGALQDRERATLVGMTTFGKGSVQLAYDLSDGSSVHVTSARWLTPNRHQLDQQGLTPDIVVEPTEEAIAAGEDEILNRAVQFLEGNFPPS